MEKRKKWQFYLIIAVFALTIYNILPTIFFYSQPLKEPVDASRAVSVAESIVERVNDMEDDAVAWVKSFSANLGIKPVSVHIKEDDPQLVVVDLASAKDERYFKHFLASAGPLIPFVPAQLEALGGQSDNENKHQVLVARQIPVRFDNSELGQYFHYTSKYNEEHQISEGYQSIINDRVAEVALAFGGTSPTAAKLALIADNPSDSRYDDSSLSLAKEIVETERSLGKSSPILHRWFASFSQINRPDAKELTQKYLARLKLISGRIDASTKALSDQIQKEKEDGNFASTDKEEAYDLYLNNKKIISAAIGTIEKNLSAFNSGVAPLTKEQVDTLLSTGAKEMGNDNLQSLSLDGHNPFIEAFLIDWDNDQLLVKLYSDVKKIHTGETLSEATAYLQERLNQLIINTLAQGASTIDEKFTVSGDTYAIHFTTLTDTQSVLAFNLGYLAEKQGSQLLKHLSTQWDASHVDFAKENYPIRDFSTYRKQGVEEQKLGLVVYAPAMYEETPLEGFNKSSLYVIARGLGSIENKYKQFPNSEESKLFSNDVKQLSEILQRFGFIGYSGNSYGVSSNFKDDYIFELDDYYGDVIKATRENFYVKGSKTLAILDMTDVEQRLLARNKIEDSMQEDLLRWKEEYDQAQVSPEPMMKYLVPPPTKSPYWQNFLLSFKKYFRGDDSRILKWGLDLSGGKTVRIGLRDQNNKVVTDPVELNNAVNELYVRVNKMGVSERKIRIENNNIILDFPGSQGLSASELIKASAMYFHIVNEKFAPSNTALYESVNEYLQNVWNEAVVTNRKDIEGINEIAWQHLGGDFESNEIHPRGETARLLYESGFRLGNPKDSTLSYAFNDAISSIAMLREEDFSEWKGEGRTHPLVVIFKNYALEGASLENIQVGQDQTQGNYLSFQVKNSYKNGDGSPSANFYAWTSQFAGDRIVGTPKESYTKGRGWRMAVILNNRIVSMPALQSALRDGGMISGRFTQSEVQQLSADLKAGSLSFTPYILSEQNVSPELGKEERSRGIIASIIALCLVVVIMVGYYRFAGIVASCAVLFNLLIMWGVLQNIGAALTLPGIAGIVLTIGMAVDANVLVFERFREEFKISGRLGSAMQAGYRKAFSAIVDSNVTTIIAAIILLQFDSGPIKGFAVTLIIGIVSSMFTALFMTRYFFAGWMNNPKNTSLTFSEFIGKTNFNFLAQAKKAFIITAIFLVAGGYTFFVQKNSMFGMDFTGGYSLTLEVEDQPNQTDSYRYRIANAFVDAGVRPNDVDVRELSRATQLRIQLSTVLEEVGNPFYGMPQDLQIQGTAFQYQLNPRLSWLVDVLEKADIKISDSQLEQLDKNWTVMSGQFSDEMRNNALMALSLALISILAYITLRFEFKYAVAAVIGLSHDVLLTLGVLAFFHAMGFAIQINLEIIGALMTIIGYSLNDTIIVFDRVREDVRLYRKMSFAEVINHALNVTLSRTIMTSLTTVIVLVTLVLFGGKSIFGFSLVMTIGVFIGTLSSLFIASPILLYFHNREVNALSDNHVSAKKV